MNIPLELQFPADDFSIYIHIPFCMRRCRYCAFISSVPKHVPDSDYSRAVRTELALRLPQYRGRRLRTLYFGGGTPTMMTDNALRDICDDVRKKCGNPEEITLEANPEHVSPARAEAWKSMGITRISLGIQSFDDEMLNMLGRHHTGSQAMQAVDDIHHAGIHEISIDLIYGGCKETLAHDDFDAQMERWQKELHTAKSLAPAHVSCYELTLEEHTPLWVQNKRGQTVLCTDDIAAAMISIIPDALDAVRYEISNYSRNGYFSAHNLSCWAGLPYLGLGPGSHAFLPQNGQYQRMAHAPRVKDYIDSLCADTPTLPAPLFTEQISPKMHLAELLMCAARTTLTWTPQALADLNNTEIQPFLKALDKAVSRNLLRRLNDGRFQTTEQGILLNNILDEIIFSGT